MYHQADTFNYSDLSLMGRFSQAQTEGGLDPLMPFFGINPQLEGHFHDYGYVGNDVLPADHHSGYSDPAVEMYSVVDYELEEEGGYGGKPISEGGVQLVGNKRRSRGVEEGGSHKNEKQRRQRLTNKFEVLKSLIPNPTKPDRATTIADTITYIHELLRMVDELNILVQKKRLRFRKSSIADTISRDEITFDDDHENAEGDMESIISTCIMKPPHHHHDLKIKGLSSSSSSSPLMRSSWIQRKTKEGHVDVRIVEEEVFIKITLQKRMEDCLVLLFVVRVLDGLGLEILHLSGGNIIGDFYNFMFNAKIHEGSSLYAGAIAKKIIEAMGAQHPQFTSASF